MSDLISREDAIKAVTIAVLEDKDEIEALKAIPSVQVNGDLISRQDAIEAVCGVVIDEFDVSPTKGYEVSEHALSALPSAENSNAKTQNSNQETQNSNVDLIYRAEDRPTVIRSRSLMPTKDFKEWAKRVRETNPNAVVIPCDAEVVSAEAVQIPIKLEKRYPESKDEDITDAFMRGYLAGRSSAEAVQGWIPVEEQPPVFPCLVCDANGNQPSVPLGIVTITDEEHGEWHIDGRLWDSPQVFVEGEWGSQLGYGNRIIAWMPLPKPYREDGEA